MRERPRWELLLRRMATPALRAVPASLVLSAIERTALCLRLQRGCGVRGWGRREGAEGVDVAFS